MNKWVWLFSNRLNSGFQCDFKTLEIENLKHVYSDEIEIQFENDDRFNIVIQYYYMHVSIIFTDQFTSKFSLFEQIALIQL